MNKHCWVLYMDESINCEECGEKMDSAFSNTNDTCTPTAQSDVPRLSDKPNFAEEACALLGYRPTEEEYDLDLILRLIILDLEHLEGDYRFRSTSLNNIDRLNRIKTEVKKLFSLYSTLTDGLIDT